MRTLYSIVVCNMFSVYILIKKDFKKYIKENKALQHAAWTADKGCRFKVSDCFPISVTF